MDLINTSFLHNKEVVMVIRLVVAAILGGIVGIERGSGDRPARFPYTYSCVRGLGAVYACFALRL